LLSFNVFMGLRPTPRSRGPVGWYDYVLSTILTACFIYLTINGKIIAMRMWEPPPTLFHLALATTIAILALEAARRIAGWPYVAMLVVLATYPLIADRMPGVLFGYPFTFAQVMGDYAYGANGIMGLPGQILGELIPAFLLFAAVMVGMGGGDFFLRLATALAGRFRGGPAKIAVVASGFFGALSGSAVVNIVGTGAFTIPAMKRLGYPPHYAGAIEACASTGGAITPPILGGLVFLASMISGIPYADFVVAIVIPAFLYYFGLLIQVDAYAARTGLKGLPRNELPAFAPILKDGWMFLVALLFLAAGLVYFRWGAISAVYAVGLLLLLLCTNKRTFPTWRRIERAVVNFSGLLNFVVGIFLSLGLVFVGLFKTGMAGALTAWIVNTAGGNLYLVLLVGVVFTLIMGMVGLETLAYVFLAVTMAPAMVKMGGIPETAAHLFIICFAILGGLTPPVAINAFVAASIAGAPPMKTAFTAVRLGIVLVFVPLFFVLQPALVMQGTPLQIISSFLIALLGIYLLASGIEGFLIKVGQLSMLERLLVAAGGFFIAFPETLTTIIGVSMALAGVAISLGRRWWARRVSSLVTRH
ncbi:MAG: TRAP transporter fused permease subunit, partial [Dehalococcoidia bacterium]|nr:TRAP transporter fused permease subunit [Dehalococcoidia bacterium]